MTSHKKAIPRAMVVGMISTAITYVFGVFFSDVWGFPYLIVGLFSAPVTFSVAYLLNRYWVFQEEKNEGVFQWENIDWSRKGVKTCHGR